MRIIKGRENGKERERGKVKGKETGTGMGMGNRKWEGKGGRKRNMTGRETVMGK